MKRSFVSFFQFSKKNLRRLAAGRFSKFPDAQQRFYREMNSIKFFGGSHFTFWCNLAGIALNFSKSCSMDNEPPRPLLVSCFGIEGLIQNGWWLGGNVDVKLFWRPVNIILDFCFAVVIFDSFSSNFSPNKHLFLIPPNSNDCSFRISFTFVEFVISFESAFIRR